MTKEIQTTRQKRVGRGRLMNNTRSFKLTREADIQGASTGPSVGKSLVAFVGATND